MQQTERLHLSVFAIAIFASVASGDTIQWLSLADAIQTARDEKKMVMVVQGPDPIGTSANDAKSAKEYERAALCDSRFLAFFDFRVAAHFRATGPLKNVFTSTGKPPSQRPSHANVITYFCDVSKRGDLRVMHFFVGFPTMAQLQSHCEFAEELHTKTAHMDSSARHDAIGLAHRKRLQRNGFDKSATTGLSPEQILKAAAKQRDVRLLARYGAGWTTSEQRKLVGSLRVHAELENAAGHWLLGSRPLIELAEIESIAFQHLTRQTYWKPPPQPAQLVKWFRQQRERNRVLLIVISKDAPARTKELTSSFHHLGWQPKRDSLRAIIADLDAIEVSRPELALLIQQFGLTAPNEKRSNGRRVAIMERDTNDLVYVDDTDNEARLQRLLIGMLEK